MSQVRSGSFAVAKRLAKACMLASMVGSDRADQNFGSKRQFGHFAAGSDPRHNATHAITTMMRSCASPGSASSTAEARKSARKRNSRRLRQQDARSLSPRAARR